MTLRKEQSKRICRIIDNYLSNRPGERDELIVATQKAFEALDKDTNVPTNSALDHIHNVVAENERKRGYEQGKADANHPEIPNSWILCSKKMPESADCPMDCLVTRKSKTIGNYTDMAVAEKSGTWTHEDWEAIVLGDNVSGKKTGLLNTRGDEIVAWMPLPEPWKGEQNGQVD